MKKLLFVLCMIGAFGISSLAQSSVSIPASNTPVHNVCRFIHLGSWEDNLKIFPHITDFLGGYDMSSFTGDTYSWFSLDFSTTPINDLNVSIEYNIDGSLHSDQLGGSGSLFASYVTFDESGATPANGPIPTLYSESSFSENGKTGLGFVAFTSDCIPTMNAEIEFYVGAEILWDNGTYSSLDIYYDYMLEDWGNE